MPDLDAAELARHDCALTIAEMRRALAEKFRAAAIDSPELDARVLVGHALSLDHAALAAASERLLDTREQETIAEFARRRLAREPVARIVGNKEFWSLKLVLDSSTLVPRPETETVVEAALAAIEAEGPRTRALRVADLGTGSGALLLALLAELPNAFGVGTDIKPRRAVGGATQRPTFQVHASGVPGMRHGRGATRSVRSDRVQSALYRVRRYRQRWPPKYAISTRGPHSTADRTVLTIIV